MTAPNLNANLDADLADADRLPVQGVTIDPPGSRDLDDALWLDGRTLTVCIPDVTANVPRGGVIEQNARTRGFTRYFAHDNAPMLPRHLAEDLLSLLPHQPRRVFVIEITLDDALDAAHTDVRRGLLTSRAQLAYTDIPALLAHPAHPQAALRPVLASFWELASGLLHKRRQRGELAYYDLKQALAMDEEGQVRRLEAHEANIGCILVQEMMLLANRAIAEWLLASDLPALYRNHRASVAAPPRTALLEDMALALEHPEAFDLATVRKRLHLLLGRARYAPVVEGHYGLNLPCYAHVTSPIRRYADFVNNQVMGEIVAARQQGRPAVAPYSMEELTRTGDHLYALVMEQELRRDARYRAMAEARARVNIETTPAALSVLPAVDYERVLKVSAPEPSTPPVLESMRERMQAETLKERELFLALFETLGEDTGWNALRQDALTYLAAHPPLAVSLLAMGVNLLQWPGTRFTQQRAGLHFICQARQVRPTGKLETGAVRAASKKAAQQASAVAMCYLLCGQAMPEAEGANAVSGADAENAAPKADTENASPAASVENASPMSNVENVDPASEIENAAPSSAKTTDNAAIKGADNAANKQAADFDWGCVQPMVEIGSYTGALQEACARTRQHKPRLVFSVERVEREGHKDRDWRCKAQATWEGASYTSEAVGHTKKEAGNKACERLMADIFLKRA